MPNVQRPKERKPAPEVPLPMRFQTRLFAILSLFALVPAVILTILGGVTVGGTLPLITGPARWDTLAATGQRAIAVADSLNLTEEQREAFDDHARELSTSLEQAQRLNYLLERGAKLIAISSFVALALITFGASRVARHLSRQLSRPIDELVEWTDLIRRGESLPNIANSARAVRGAPEFETLRQRMRVAAVALEIGRQRAMEAERLRAFRESARQAAHELKNPLTPIRFAISRLKRDLPPELEDTLDVLEIETARLERTANSFSQFGKLPEGPVAPVDIGEMLKYVTASSIPGTMTVDQTIEEDLPMITGYYDALAGALINVVLNAVDACERKGTITVSAHLAMDGEVEVIRIKIRDTGPGISPEHLKRIWEPYETQKAGGTGLGLTIARQAVWAHQGSVNATSTLGEGTEIEFNLPIDSNLNSESV